LQQGEHIKSIEGRAGEWIDKLKIVTDKNQVLECGGNGGNHFGNILPHHGHHKLCGIGGSVSTYLMSLYFLYE